MGFTIAVYKNIHITFGIFDPIERISVYDDYLNNISPDVLEGISYSVISDLLDYIQNQKY
jgi:hypothetical protein